MAGLTDPHGLVNALSSRPILFFIGLSELESFSPLSGGFLPHSLQCGPDVSILALAPVWSYQCLYKTSILKDALDLLDVICNSHSSL